MRSVVFSFSSTHEKDGEIFFELLENGEGRLYAYSLALKHLSHSPSYLQKIEVMLGMSDGKLSGFCISQSYLNEFVREVPDVPKDISDLMLWLSMSKDEDLLDPVQIEKIETFILQEWNKNCLL